MVLESRTMIRMTTWRGVAWCALTLIAACTLVPAAAGQQTKAPAKYQFKIGVLPFVDNTGSGGEDVGVAVGRAVQAEITHSTQLIGKVLAGAADNVDGARAAEIGREAKVDVVLVGLVLEASSEESNKNVQSRSIFGQTVGGSSRTVSSVVTLQGDLYNVADGEKIESLRVTGKATDRKVGADVSTDFGSISTGGSSFDKSPIGKALQQAVADLVKRINALQSKMVPNPQPTEPK